jgi:hypothetical protein
MLITGVFSSAFGGTITCGYNPIPVTPGLVAACGYSLALNFGANPLPDGGQLDLNAFYLTNIGSDELEYDLNFAFPHPAIGTTVLEYTACCTPILGFSLTAQGSDFSITEAFPGSNLPDLNLDASGLTVVCPPMQQCTDQSPLETGPFLVVTTITDNAGDLSHFQEGFVVPEPKSWKFLAAGLLCIGVLLRFKRRLQH